MSRLGLIDWDEDAGWHRELARRAARTQALDPRDPACSNYGESDDDEPEDDEEAPLFVGPVTCPECHESRCICVEASS